MEITYILSYMVIAWVITILLNLLIMFNVRGINLPYKKNKYMLKKNPLYKLESDGYNYFNVVKYEIEWTNIITIHGGYVCIPFSAFFNLFRYVKQCNVYGNYTYYSLQNGIGDDELKDIWERGNEPTIIKKEQERLALINVDKYNEEFNEYYE